MLLEEPIIRTARTSKWRARGNRRLPAEEDGVIFRADYDVHTGNGAQFK